MLAAGRRFPSWRTEPSNVLRRRLTPCIHPQPRRPLPVARSNSDDSLHGRVATSPDPSSLLLPEAEVESSLPSPCALPSTNQQEDAVQQDASLSGSGGGGVAASVLLPDQEGTDRPAGGKKGRKWRRRMGLDGPLGPLMPSGPLPTLADCMHFVNLTNGIEAIPVLESLGLPHYAWVRLSSTSCEQGDLEGLLLGLDSNLLMHLALGRTCLVWDLGSRNKEIGIPRALWYGLEFVRYTLMSKWHKTIPRAHLRGQVVSDQFEERLAAMAPATLKKINYYSRWLVGTEVHLHGVYRSGGTGNERIPDFYEGLLRSAAENGHGSCAEAAGLERLGQSERRRSSEPHLEEGSSGSEDPKGADASSSNSGPSENLDGIDSKPGAGSEGLQGEDWGAQRAGESSEEALLRHRYHVHYRGLEPAPWTAWQEARRAARADKLKREKGGLPPPTTSDPAEEGQPSRAAEETENVET